MEYYSRHPIWSHQVHSDYEAVIQKQSYKCLASHKTSNIRSSSKKKGKEACITLNSGTACNGCSPMHTKSTPIPVNKAQQSSAIHQAGLTCYAKTDHQFELKAHFEFVSDFKE